MSAPLRILILSGEAEGLRDQLAPLGEAVSIEIAHHADEAMPKVGDAAVIVAMPHLLTQALLDAAGQLRWLQLLTSGVDPLDRLRLNPNVVLSTAKGVHGPQMAELVFFYMLSLLRDPEPVRMRRRSREWRPQTQPLLFGKRALIVGVGTIAEAIATRAKAFGMTVIGVSNARRSAPGFDHILPRGDLHAGLAGADFVVVLAPLTAETERLIDRAALAAMPPHARLINVGRGGVVDEYELCLALTEGRIAGAGLDVFEREPLPADSALWSLENVIVTPHVGGRSDIYAEQLGPLLRENLAAWLAGQPPPINLVDRSSRLAGVQRSDHSASEIQGVRACT